MHTPRLHTMPCALMLRATAMLAAALLAVGCGHTNNLAKYPVSGGSAVFRASVRGGAATSHVIVESPSSNAVAEVAAIVSSIAIGSSGRARLEQAIVGDSIAAAVARGVERSAIDYLSMRPVGSIDENPAFIVEVDVEEYALVSGSFGMMVRVKGHTRIIDRASGGIVWEDSEAHDVPLSQTLLAGFGPRVVRSAASIYNVVQLLQLSDEELRRVVNEGAAEAGREIGEELREDAAEMRAG
jgi:hypothetical protein